MLKNIYRSGLLFCVVGFFGVTVTSSALAGKLYKWVDKNGQTHYSQIPPEKDQVKAKSDISEKSDTAAIPVMRKGDYAYCGDMQLPGPLYEPKSILMGLGGRVESWEKSLKESEKSLTAQLRELGNRNNQKNRYTSSSNNIVYSDMAAERRKTTARRIKEYRCALAWAERQKDKYSDLKQEIAHDLKGAKANYQAVLDAAHKDCGFEPKDYANPSYNEKKSAWKKCMRPHDRKIRLSKNNLEQLRRQSGKLD